MILALLKRNPITVLLVLNMAMFGLTAFFQDSDFALILHIVIVIILFFLKRDDWKLFIFTILFASVIEPFAVHSRIWIYPNPGPNFLNVPYWIFLMWGVASVSAYRMGTYFYSNKA